MTISHSVRCRLGQRVFSGDGGNRTRVRRCLPKYSPGAVRSALFSAPALTRTSR